jgi:ubiquinol-cytochrome c reductase cytochrome b subunit
VDWRRQRHHRGRLRLSINAITHTLQVLLIVLPPISFVVTKRICLGLQRRDRDKVLHGRETGTILRFPHGEFVELHEPISAEERYKLTQHQVHRPAELPAAVDDNGIPSPGTRMAKLRAKVSRWYFEERVEPPTPREVQELEAAHH